MCCTFVRVLRNFPIGTTSFSGFMRLIAFNPLNAILGFGDLENFTISPTSCSGHNAVASFLCSFVLKPGLISSFL